MRTLVAVVAVFSSTALLFLNASAHPVVTIDPAITDPHDDPFYDVPVNIHAYDNGEVVDSRKVVTFLEGHHKAYQIKYRTTDGEGFPVSTLATLWVPESPAHPPKIFGLQVPEDAINLSCAGSWAWLAHSLSNNKIFIRPEGTNYIPWALSNGSYVVSPDAYGPQSTLLVGRMEGRATLDAVRAVMRYEELDNSETKVALYGWSGGAYSTLWASSLAESYAQELNIVGAAYGGTPLDIRRAIAYINGRNASYLAGVIFFSLPQAYPELRHNYQTGADGLTVQGKSIQRLYRSRGYCPNSEPGNFVGVDWNLYFKQPFEENPILLSVEKRESLLMNFSSEPVPVPKFPRLEIHSTVDEEVEYSLEAEYVKQQCSKGANIQFPTFHGLEHVATDYAAVPYVHKFLEQAFAGTTPDCKCGTTDCRVRHQWTATWNDLQLQLGSDGLS